MDTDSGDQNGAKKSNVLPFWDDSSSDVPDDSTCRDGSADQTTLTELRPVTPFQLQSASSYESSPAVSIATISSLVSKICIPTPMPSPPPYHTKCNNDFCPIHSQQIIESDTSCDEIIFPSSRLKIRHSRQKYLNNIGKKYWMKLQAIEEEDHDNSVTQQNASVVVQSQVIEEPSNSMKQQDAPISPIAQSCPTRSNTESTVMASPASSAQSQSFYGSDSSVSELAIPRQSKKRSKCRDNWADTRRKRQKNLGQEYSTKTGKLFNAKQMRPPCSCKFKCFNRISYEQRLDIFRKFWELGDRKKQWEYVLKYTTKEKKKRCLYQDTSNKRTFTYNYYLPLSLDKSTEQASSINVCKKMFLNTISLSDRIIKTAWDKYDNSTIVEDDYRGCHKNHKKVIIEDMITSVCDHVNSFVPIESHYLRKKTTKLYLDGSLNIARMFKLYMEWFDTDKYTSKAETERQYREIVKKKFNLCFFIPKKDQCDVCHAHRNLQNPSTEQIEEYQKHQTAKTVARSLKGEDKKEAMSSDGKILCAVFDFEKVLPCPHGQVSIFYYKRKLSCLNFTVYDMASKQATCYMWDETVAKRGANEVSSCLFDYIDTNWKNGVQEFRFWSDNCAGQNRNRINFFFYMYAAQKYKINIKHSFLEKGHTQNEGDSVHSVIENASANKTIYTPEEWSLLVRWSKSNGPPYEVKNMSQNDFYDFKSHIKNSAWNKNNRGQKIEWTRIKEVFVHKEDPHELKYRYNLTEEYETFTIKPTTRRSQGLPVIAKAYDAPIPLNIDKYKDIVSLCNSGIIPIQYKDYFMSLPRLDNDYTRDNCDITDSEHSD